MRLGKFRFRKGETGPAGSVGCVDELGPLENDTRPPDVIAAEAKKLQDMAAEACRLHWDGYGAVDKIREIQRACRDGVDGNES